MRNPDGLPLEAVWIPLRLALGLVPSAHAFARVAGHVVDQLLGVEGDELPAGLGQVVDDADRHLAQAGVEGAEQPTLGPAPMNVTSTTGAGGAVAIRVVPPSRAGESGL